ncbi:MAG: hypothetical protein AAF485_19775 [Chloroflexota bacterium]
MTRRTMLAGIAFIFLGGLSLLSEWRFLALLDRLPLAQPHLGFTIGGVSLIFLLSGGVLFYIIFLLTRQPVWPQILTAFGR